MKSLLISSVYFPPRTGGISHFMEGIAAALGPDRVCCLTGTRTNGSVLHDGLKPRVYRRPAAFAKSAVAKSRPLRAVCLGTTVAEIMLRERPKAVQLATIGEGYLGHWLRRWFKLPYVVYAHGNEILGAIRSHSPGPRLALQKADRVLANSQFTASLVQKAGVDSSRVEVVSPGCDVNRFRPLQPRMEQRHKLLGARHRGRVILTIGYLGERKGHDMVIRTLPRLRQSVQDVTYLIVGNGPCRSQLEALATAMGVRDQVIFAGQVPAADLPEIYALSDVFVMPSRARVEKGDVEGFGLVFLEANACARPVIGGRSGGIPDAIIDGVTGLLVNPEDSEEIADALTRLLTDTDLAFRMGQQGRLRVVRDFAWARVADQVQRVLGSLRH